MKATEVQEVTFFGKITAGFTHEVKNILAIIRESAGLMEDLLSLEQYQALPHRDKFLQRLTTIQNQVRRGVELTTRLNRFAHSADEPLMRIDLNELTAQLALLSERFARLKNTSLKVSPGQPAPILVTSPMRLQMALFLSLQCCWNQMPGGGEVQLRLADEGDRAAIEIACVMEQSLATAFNAALRHSVEWPAVAATWQSLGGELAVETPFDGVRLVLPKEQKSS